MKMSEESFEQRNQTIVERHQNGDTLQDIGRDYGISREQVRRIVLCWEHTVRLKLSPDPVDHLTPRTRGALRRHGPFPLSVEALALAPDDELLAIPMFGPTMLADLRRVIPKAADTLNLTERSFR